MSVKQKSSSTPKFLALGTFRKLLIVFPKMLNLVYFLYSLAQRSSNLHLRTFLRTLTLITNRTNLELHNISVTLKMVKMVIRNLNLSKASGADCILVVVLKNCEDELVSERVFFSRLLEGFTGSLCI